MFDPVTQDPPADLEFPAHTFGVRFASHGSTLNGVYFRASGSSAKGTVVLLHGLPGNDRNLDLAHVCSRAGLNALVFHYRGAWGSEGEYGFSNALEDVDAAIAWLLDSASELRVDPLRLALVGHSLGGWAALMTAATNDRVRVAASLAGANLGAMWLHAAGHEDRVEALEAMMGSLTAIQRGATGQGLVAEMREHHREWDLAVRAADFKGKPILLVAGSRDDDIPPAFHHAALVRAFEVAGTRASVLELDADHMFADKRIALARGLLGWLLAHL